TVTAAGFNTGLAFANTTTDPGTTALGFAQAVRQTGGITFYFYPASGSAFSYATKAGSPGTGLDASGNVPTGGSYIVLLSQLLAAAGAPADFSGYIVAICNYTNGHGLFEVFNNSGAFTQGAVMIVLPGSRLVLPELGGR